MASRPPMNGEDVTAFADITSDLEDGTATFEANAPAVVAPDADRAAPAGTQPVNRAPNAPAVEAKPADKAPSIRDLLSNAFKAEPAAPAGERARDPATGQFVPTPAEAAAAAAAPAAQGTAPVNAPAGMSPADAAIFAQLPAEQQQFVARTMAGVAQSAMASQGLEGLDRVIGERAQAWAMNGHTPAQAVTQLLALSDFATGSPAEFIQWFAQNNSIDLLEVGAEAPQVDPVIQGLQSDLAQLRQQVGNTSQQQAEAHRTNIVAEITTFAEAKGADGTPLRPYFDEVAAHIYPQLQIVQAQNPTLPNADKLAMAYEAATYLVPSVREKVIASQVAAREAERLTAARANGGRAIHASASVTGAPANGATAPVGIGDGSIRGILQAEMSRMNA